MFFIYLLLSFSLMFRKKNYVKPFLGLPDWTCFHSNRPIIKTAPGHVGQSFNPLNGILQAGFHTNFHGCRISVLFLSHFIFGPHDLWIHVLLPSFIFLTENNICPFLVHVNVMKLSNQCGQNKIYKNPCLSIFSWPLLFGHLKGLTSVLFCCLVALSKHAYFDF